MAFDFIAWHGRDPSNHNAETAKAAAVGYRTSSLCMYGETTNPLFAAVMVKRTAVHAEQQFICLTMTQIMETIDMMWKKNYGAYLITATGTVKKPLFSASFRPMVTAPIIRLDILGNGNQMFELNYHFWRQGYIPVSLDAYGTPEDTQIVAIWHANTDRIAWNIGAASQLSDLPTRQAIFNAITAQGARPNVIAMAPGGRFFGVFIDNAVGSWASRSNMTGDSYQQVFNQQVAAGRCPICVSAQGIGADTHYSAVFADQEKPLNRVTTLTTVPQGSTGVKGN